MTLMLKMQQQQMDMQQQMAALMTQLLPSATSNVEHRPPPPPPNRPPARAKIERPIIDADCSDNRWIIFRDAWTRYKEMATLTTPAEIRNELRSACTAKVNEMLFNFVGPDVLNNATENDLMKHIKAVAVRTIHPEVYRQQFFTMKQTDGESITTFISRLKAQAMLCAFTCKETTCTVSYSEDMVKSQLIAGTRNPSHQSKVLSETQSLKTLEEVSTRLLDSNLPNVLQLTSVHHLPTPISHLSFMITITRTHRIRTHRIKTTCSPSHVYVLDAERMLILKVGQHVLHGKRLAVNVKSRIISLSYAEAPPSLPLFMKNLPNCQL